MILDALELLSGRLEKFVNLIGFWLQPQKGLFSERLEVYREDRMIQETFRNSNTVAPRIAWHHVVIGGN